MKNIVVPLVCLLAGGAAGYGLRFVSEGGEKKAAQAEIGGTKTTSGSNPPASESAAGAPTVSATTGAASPSAPAVVAIPLADQMKELLVDYDLKSAQRAAAKLSAADLQAALALTAAMPKSVNRDSLRSQLYRAWAVQNPQAAWQAALADPLDKNKGAMLAAVAGVLAKTNPTAALDLTMSLGMGGLRSTVMSSVFTEWSRADPVAAIAYVNAHPELPVDRMSSISMGLPRLAETDPLRAANAAITVKDTISRSTALSSVMSTWVERDPAGALSWAKSLSGSSQQKDAISAVIGAWVKSDPAAALAQVQAISDADTRSSVLKKGWTDWFRNDPTAATTYLAAPENGTFLESMGYMFGLMTDGFSPQERAKLLSQIPEGKAREDVQRSMTDTQVRKGQFNQALEMLNAMPESVNRDRSVHKLGEEWAKSDLKAAEAWLKLQPDSSDRDLAVAGYTAVLARSDPHAAIEWLNSVPDLEVRKGAMRNIATQWFKADAANAETWMSGVKEFSNVDRDMIRRMGALKSDYTLSLPPKVSTRR